MINRIKSSETVRFIKSGHTCLGVVGSDGLTLTGGDRNDSLLWSRKKGESEGQLHTWSPWGNGNPAKGLPGFNGERRDPLSGSYHLGNGYRAYNPVLMRFNCPDDLSPFGAGGINPYAYCAGDPINHTDPSGHMSWQGIVGIVASGIGLALAGITAGASIAAAGGIVAAISAAPLATAAGGLAVVADATGIASIATEERNPSASAVLGWVSFGTGVAGMIAGLGPLAYQGTQRLRNRLQNIQHTGLSGRGAPAAARALNNGQMRDSDFVGGIRRVTRPTEHEITALRRRIDRLRQDYERRVSQPVPGRWRGARRTATLNDFPAQARQGVPLYFVEQGGELTYIATAPRYSADMLERMPMNIRESILYQSDIPEGASGLLRGSPETLSDFRTTHRSANMMQPQAGGLPTYEQAAAGLPTYEQATAGLPTYEQALSDSFA